MKILISIFGLFSLINCGTDQGEGKTYNYSIKNESGVPISLTTYYTFNSDLDPVVTTIDVNETLSKTFNDGLPPSDYNFIVFLSEGNIVQDSLVVIFDDKRKTSFTRECSDNVLNPINTCLYGSTKEDFVFTKADFDRAVPF